MKKTIHLLILIFTVLCFVTMDVSAYTKDDIINAANNINTCSSKTNALLKGTKASYTRLLNERDVSSRDLNKIYNNINTAVGILNSYNLCSIDQKEQMPEKVKNRLYNLYQESNNLILASPKLSDKQVSDSKVVIDSTTNEIKIYEDGALSDVIKLEEKLNYVGLNKIVITSIVLASILFIGCFILTILKKGNVLVTSILYAMILVLPVMICFRDKISLALDTIDLMNVNLSEKNKEVKTEGKKIIAYPLYGDEYAKIYINGKSESIYFGDSSDILKKGIGQASSSYMPGEEKTTILSGHNTGLFKKLLNLKKNNKFIIETVYGKFTYKVMKTQVVKDTDIDVLKSDYDLIMYTCCPDTTLYGNKRMIVYSNIVDSKWVGEDNEE